MEFVKVAGTAITIHQTIPIRKSLPFPLTRLDTNAPSIAATFKLIRVLMTKNTLWDIRSLSSALLQPGMHIFSSLKRFLKNSRLSSTFCLFGGEAELFASAVAGRLRASATRKAAAFCSLIALRMRFKRAKKSVRYTVRDMAVRWARYLVVREEMMEAISRSAKRR